MFQNTNYTFVQGYGNRIFHRYKEGHETVNSVVSDFKPTTYTEINDPDARYESIFGDRLKPTVHNSVKDCRAFADKFKDVNNFKLFGTNNYGLQFITEKYDKQISFDVLKLRGCVYDIEVESKDGFPKAELAESAVISICAFDTKTQQYYVFGSKPYEHDTEDEDVGDLPIKHIQFATEEELLLSFINFVHNRNFDYITGWFSGGFDDPYIVHRCTKLLGDVATNKLSPFGIVNMHYRPGPFGKEVLKGNIFGLEQLDYQELYKKNVQKVRENYKLDYISSVELNTRKISYDEHRTLQDLYENDYNKFIRYNIKDVNIIVRLEVKLQLFQLIYTQAYRCKCNPSTTLGTVAPWECLAYSDNYYKNRIEQFYKKKNQKIPIEGAFVFPAIAGKHKWVLAIDLDSLYPHIEMQYNIGPETYIKPSDLPDELRELRRKYTKDPQAVDKLINREIDLSILKKYNYSMTAAFEFYSKERMSFFSEIKRELYNDRKVVKRQMIKLEQEKGAKEDISRLDNSQKATKLLLNGGYGALCKESYKHYMIQNARSITLSGQLSNKSAGFRVNRLINTLSKTVDKNYIVAGDTDSCYFSMDSIVQKAGWSNLPDKEICAKLDVFFETIVQPRIEECYEELADYMNAYEQKMNMSREVIASSAIWVAKKRYVMNVLDNEGILYDPPKKKITGLEAIKGDTAEWSKKWLKECYDIGLSGDEKELQKFVSDKYSEFLKIDVTEIGIPTGANHIEKYTDSKGNPRKGAQQHIRSAIYHNKIVNELGLNIQILESGGKIKMLHLDPSKNKYNYDIIGFDTFLPKELGLDHAVNKDLIWQKGFIDPLKVFLSALNWSHKRIATLSSLF